MNNAQRIRFLNKPELLAELSSENSDTLVAESKISEFAKSILDSISAAIDTGDFPLAGKLLYELEKVSTDTTSEVQGWILFFKGTILDSKGLANEALEAFRESAEIYPSCWPLFKIGKIHEAIDPLKAYEFYTQALSSRENLTPEVRVYVESWLASFYDEKIYKRYNHELLSLDLNLFNHFIQYGYAEGRIGGVAQIKKNLADLSLKIPNGFNWKLYLEVNPDLEGLITEESDLTLLDAEYKLTSHFANHGIAENRTWQIQGHSSSIQSIEEPYNQQKIFISRKLAHSLKNFLRSKKYISIGSDDDTAIVTIILILFNKAELTYGALLSIVQSSVQNVNLIIVDNNSTDDTSLLLQRLRGNVRIIRNEHNLHFLRSVNIALSYANSKYIALLNNDATLHPETLEESLRCIIRYNDNAIVGGKVLHFDGYIQDAGSIVFNDGSCKGLGRRFVPNHHLFNFERTVDYVSGAFLFAPLKLVQKLGGLDEAYAPAYYEETDFCFRAKSLNIPVIYNPNIIIHHLEFGSSQKAEQAIRLMEINKEKFKANHEDVLRSSLNPALFREDKIECLLHGHLGDLPKVLIIEDRVPLSSLGSGFSRSFEILTLIKQNSSHVTLYATDYARSQASAYELPIGIECIENDQEYLRGILRDRNHFYDYIFVSRAHNQSLFDQILAEFKTNNIEMHSTIIYDAESLFSIRDFTKMYLLENERHIRSLEGVDLSGIAEEELMRFESADVISSVSSFESGIISKKFPDKKVLLLGHPFDPVNTEDDFDLSVRDKIIFLGAIYEQDSPNHDSLEWLYKDVLPILDKENIPNLLIEIGGNIQCAESLDIIEQILSKFSFVKFKGEIIDLQSFFSEARLFLAPTRYAAGIPHKIHMASSHGVPSLTTSFVAEQMGWKNNGAIMTANDASDFASAIRNAYSDTDCILDCRSKMINAFNSDCSPVLFSENIKKIFGLGNS